MKQVPHCTVNIAHPVPAASSFTWLGTGQASVDSKGLQGEKRWLWWESRMKGNCGQNSLFHPHALLSGALVFFPWTLAGLWLTPYSTARLQRWHCLALEARPEKPVQRQHCFLGHSLLQPQLTVKGGIPSTALLWGSWKQACWWLSWFSEARPASLRKWTSRNSNPRHVTPSPQHVTPSLLVLPNEISHLWALSEYLTPCSHELNTVVVYATMSGWLILWLW